MKGGVCLKAEVLARNHDQVKLFTFVIFSMPALMFIAMMLVYFFVPEIYEDQELVLIFIFLMIFSLISSIFTALFLIPRFKLRFIIGIAGVSLLKGDKLIKKYAWTEIKKIQIVKVYNRGSSFNNIEISNGLENPRYKQFISNTKNSIISMPLTEEGLSVLKYYAHEYDLNIVE